MKLHTFRLKPGVDLKKGIQKFVQKHDIQAGSIVTCVAGLRQAVLRMADATPEKQVVRTYNEEFEVVSLVGTVSVNGCHLHIALSDKKGAVIGGHLKDGNLVHFTAEVVIAEDEENIFTRKLDSNTGFKELAVSPKPKS